MTLPAPTAEERERAVLSGWLVVGSRHVEAGPGCADPLAIWDAVRGACDPARVRALADHTLACPACAEAWQLAAGFAEEAARAEVAGSARDAGTRSAGGIRQAGPLIGLAAMLVLATVGAAFVVARGPAPFTPAAGGPGGPLFREDSSAAIRPLVADDAALPRDAFILAWAPYPGAERYDASLATEALKPLHVGRALREPRLEIPAERLAALPDGSRLLWRVEAVLIDGTRRASAAFFVRVGPATR